MIKRTANSLFAVGAWLSSCLLFSSGVHAETVALTAPQGKLQGVTSARSDKVAVFKNIPYALPPVGQRRWRHAKAAPSWEGIRLATDFSPACLQPPYPSDSFYAGPATPTSEDCLYLNVWTPLSALSGRNGNGPPNEDVIASKESAAPRKLPVMVWIHGGGLTRGSGSVGTYDGSALASRGVVLVTINYRLGVFGYMAHPEASAESSFGVSGNYGTSDQVMALDWVQKNIAAFGGDAENVTIFGESAGSWSVHHMLATPRAKGLFHKAIGQSGARFGRMLELRGDATSAHAQGIKLQTMLGAENLAELRNMDGPRVLAGSQPLRFGEVHDGVIFPEQFYEMFAGHRYNVVPLIVGYNADEGTTLGGLQNSPKSPEAFEELLNQRYGRLAAALLGQYPASEPKSSSLALMRDTRFGHGMHTWARFNAEEQKDTYFYYFTHAPFGEPLGAFHAAEIPYVFDNVSTSRSQPPSATGSQPVSEADRRLSQLMADYWVAFARDGKPAVEGAPQWPRYSAKKALHLEFSAEGAVQGHHSLGKRLTVLDKLSASEREGAN